MSQISSPHGFGAVHTHLSDCRMCNVAIPSASVALRTVVRRKIAGCQKAKATEPVTDPINGSIFVARPILYVPRYTAIYGRAYPAARQARTWCMHLN